MMAKHKDPTGAEHETCECIHIHHHIHIDEKLSPAALSAIFQFLADLKEGQRKIIVTQTEMSQVLTDIDGLTNKLAANVQVIADTDQTIATEMAGLEKQLADALASGGGVTQAMADQVTALKAKSQAASDALDEQVAVLQGIAANGAPVVPPAPVVVTPPPLDSGNASADASGNATA